MKTFDEVCELVDAARTPLRKRDERRLATAPGREVYLRALLQAARSNWINWTEADAPDTVHFLSTAAAIATWATGIDDLKCPSKCPQELFGPRSPDIDQVAVLAECLVLVDRCLDVGNWLGAAAILFSCLMAVG